MSAPLTSSHRPSVIAALLTKQAF